MPPLKGMPFARGGKAKALPNLHSSGYKGLGGKGLAQPLRRHRKLLKDTIMGITRPDIRRLARRGGVKRISAAIYDETRAALKKYLKDILKDCAIFLEHANRKTITVLDVIFALKRQGRPIYGFDDANRVAAKRARRASTRAIRH
ncbi:histone-fold-containing protein [Xylona heveae TC161]|uniref:Histone H4 n=1 Tax=Xylona heveae (strain CBS 132557 / TC161) TaxID=1328760 RepID=A0A164ZP50_XYLHT|nr:histone-fold-containing protein [Xylona heveae TC161]KZF19334.1 histone-fold-containing protein [Xylona heveae TC161]